MIMVVVVMMIIIIDEECGDDEYSDDDYSDDDYNYDGDDCGGGSTCIDDDGDKSGLSCPCRGTCNILSNS